MRRIVPVALLVVGIVAASVAARWTETDPPIDLAHIETGEINHWGEAVGYHHRAGGHDMPGARVLTVIEPPDANGVYRALVALRDPNTGAWVEKKEPSTFFPDGMSGEAVVAAVLEAFHHGRLRGNGRFIGPSGHGFAVEGWYERGRVVAAYPLRRPP
ncbi:MAG TPA: EndoU domain-containing protein [Stellaceae bacterium]|nr:EndoU domain-containing protein [Stellaceae bacterium]